MRSAPAAGRASGAVAVASSAQRAPAGARGRDRVHGERGALPGAQARDVAADAPAVAERPRRRGHEQARGRAVAEAHGHGAVAARAARDDAVGHRLAHAAPAAARSRRPRRWTGAGRRRPRRRVVGGVRVGRLRADHDHTLERAARSIRALTRITACAPTASVAGPQRTGRVLVHGEVARMLGVTPRIRAIWLGWRGSTCGISRASASSAGSGPMLRTRMVTVTTSPTWLTRGEMRSLTARSAPPSTEAASDQVGAGQRLGRTGRQRRLRRHRRLRPAPAESAAPAESRRTGW